MMVIELFCVEDDENGLITKREGITPSAAEEIKSLFTGEKTTITIEKTNTEKHGQGVLSWIEDPDSLACYYEFRKIGHESGGFCDKEWILHWLRRKILDMDEEEDEEVN